MTAGEGKTLLLAHGFMGSLENFDTWMPGLARIRRVLAPDLPGCGLTPPLPVPSIDGYTAWLRAFAEAVAPNELEVGGLCLGATLALDYARHWPDQVQALLLHTPLCSAGLVRARFRAQVHALSWPPIFAAVDRLRRNRTISDLYKRWVVEGPDVDPEDARINFENQVRADGFSARAWLRDALRQDYTSMMLGWPKPALILAASHDRIVRLDRMRQLAADMPRATLTIIPDAGHGWNAALIGAQVTAICDFLAAVPA